MAGIRTAVAAGVGLAGLAGALVALGLRGAPAGERNPQAAGRAGLAAEIAALRAELGAQREAGRALAREVAELRARLDGPDAAAPAGTQPGSLPVDAAGPPPPAPATPPEPAPWFDVERLLASGVSDDETRRLAEVHDRSQLDQLYLRNRATREGWRNTPRFQRESQALDDELRAELGELDYDRLLWASGRPNRVALRNVLASSPAEAAGLAPGDLILRYDDRPLFELHELVTATTQGEVGAQVPVDVLRDGDRLRFYLPRGPLGVHLIGVKRPPDPR